ncbi:alpha/beta hydrolase [Candidatus Kaiserbacteria bacterium]|nr:alpha/beta hydrolase [Candidatus Kaiserbacteria bacterium]
MRVALRVTVPVLILLLLIFVFFLERVDATAVPPPHESSLVWGDVVMLDGGTYSVSLNAPALTYVTGPAAFDIVGRLYTIDGAGERQFVKSFFSGPTFDDPDDPNDGDELFAWIEAGVYEIDILEIPPPILIFKDRLRIWFARALFADIAYAQDFPVPDPLTVLATLRFTITDANATPDPVIIVPGILGSEQHNGEWVIDPILHTYDDLIATLDENGYTREVDLFTFPYDWRKSNVETAVLLKEKINQVKDICDCDKVDLVAHSMGGLVARQYVQSDTYENDVDQLIFLGTPHLGAPKAYLMWEGGELGPTEIFAPTKSIVDEVLELILGHEAAEEGYSSLFAYLRTEPIDAVRELLPVYDYIFDENLLRDYPQNYPTNTFLEALNNNVNNLLDAGIDIHNIVGSVTEQKTIVGINVVDSPSPPMWEHGYPEGFFDLFGDHGLILGSGDNTVPLPSASFVDENKVLVSFTHNDLPIEAQPEVYVALRGQNPSVIVKNFHLPDAKILLMKILSPADLLIISPDGKKIGKDFNGQEVNEILNAFYTGFGTDTEFITILNPLDGEYKIYAQGTGSGPFTVETNLISEATTTSASFTGNTALGITSELNLEVQNGVMPPNALDVVVTYQSTLADLERIYQLKWVSIGIYKSLKAQLKAAKQTPPFIAKRILQAMLKQLNSYRGKLLNEQGYQILKSDIEFLLKS